MFIKRFECSIYVNYPYVASKTDFDQNPKCTEVKVRKTKEQLKKEKLKQKKMPKQTNVKIGDKVYTHNKTTKKKN